MKQKITTEHDKKFFRNKLFPWFKRAAALGIVLLVTLVSIFVPFQRLLPAYAIERRKEGELRVHFLDVGEGDCSLVEFPDGALLVIDAGNGDFANNNKIIRYVNGLHPSSISYVVTHAESDHYGGMARLISRYGAETVYFPTLERENANYQALKEIATRKARKTQTLLRYDTIENPSGASIVCISPYYVDEDDANDSSAVLYLSYRGVRVLFGGDISSVREQRLLRDYALTKNIFDSGEHCVRLENINVLKVSHHGSKYSSCAEWLDLISPETAVISCGKGNVYSHPAVETLTRLFKIGAEVYRTDELGALTISITDAGYEVK